MESSVNPVQHKSKAEGGAESDTDNHNNTKKSRIVEVNSKPRKKVYSTSSTPVSRKNHKQAQPSQANVIQSTPTAAQSTKYKPVNAHSRNRAETSSSGSRDKTPDKNNKKKHYIYQYETRVTFKINVSPSDDPLTKIRQIVKEYLR